MNTNFSNVVANYRSIPNPDLKPETSDSFEAGLRWRKLDFAGAKWSAELTAFTAEYEDFIDQVQVSGDFTPSTPAVYQFINLDKVEIDGVEARADWESVIAKYNGLVVDEEAQAGSVTGPKLMEWADAIANGSKTESAATAEAKAFIAASTKAP